MKVKINYRALCPYDTTPDGTDCYHWYTEEFETDSIRYIGGGVQIHKTGEKENHFSWYAHEQINILEIKD